MFMDDRLGRVLKLLQGSIRAAGFTQTMVDERIGRRRGYLSHVFQRRVDLKLVDLLKVLEVLEIDPSRFFAAALGNRQDGARDSHSAPVENVMRLVAEPVSGLLNRRGMVPPLRTNPAPEEGLDDQLLERVRRAVQSVLAENALPEPALARRAGQ